MNKVFLVGRSGKDASTTMLESGNSVTKFSMATTERLPNNNTKTEWHNVSVWGKYGELMCEYIKSGTQLAVEGRITYSQYERADGTKAVYTDIVAEKLELLGSKKSDSDGPVSNEPRPQKPAAEKTTPKPAAQQPVYSQPVQDDFGSRGVDYGADDLPF